MHTLLIIAIILLSGLESRADIYKYETDDGVITFTNTRMHGNGKVVVRESAPPQKNTKVQKYGKAQEVAYSPDANRENFHAIAEEKARQHNIDPQLVKAVIKAESNWNASAISPKGALGLMQLMPATASLLGVVNPFDPVENIDGGTRYLKYLLSKFSGSLTLALAAYNAGPKLVEKKGAVPSIPETVSYVKKVLAYYSGETGVAFNVDSQEIQKEIKREYSRIKKMVLEDGTLLFTNSYLAHSYLDK